MTLKQATASDVSGLVAGVAAIGLTALTRPAVAWLSLMVIPPLKQSYRACRETPVVLAVRRRAAKVPRQFHDTAEP